MAAVGSAAVVLACVVGLLSLAPGSPADRPDALPPPRSVDQVEAARAAVRDRPRDALAWSQLGQTETEQARTTLDAAQLDRAEKAFGRSLALRPKDNYDAVAGSGTLANARHEFTAARQFGRRATEMAPGRPAGYAALADAHIQLGEYPAATAARPAAARPRAHRARLHPARVRPGDPRAVGGGREQPVPAEELHLFGIPAYGQL
ncbi:tetratricopeptide repeat protein [Streptomyces sp. GLT-R25]